MKYEAHIFLRKKDQAKLLHKWENYFFKEWYFVTKIVLTYCEKKLF